LDRIKHTYGKGNIDYSKDEFIVICLVKDGETFIDAFIRYYLNLGAKHIFFIDNQSADKTVDMIKQHNNTSIYSTDLPFKDYECEIRRTLIRHLSKDRWCLCVDIDELFDYPYSDRISMVQFLRYLDKNRFTAVVAYMLDMFSKKPLSHLTDVENLDLEKTFCYYDISNITKEEYPLKHLYISHGNKNNLSNKEIKFYWGGIRRTFFGKDTHFFLIKHPLLFIDTKIEPFTHPHFSNNADIADVTCLLRHYKINKSLPGRSKEIVKKQDQPYYAQKEYQMYYDAFQKDQSLSLFTENSKKFRKVNELIDNGFLTISKQFIDYVSKT